MSKLIDEIKEYFNNSPMVVAIKKGFSNLYESFHDLEPIEETELKNETLRESVDNVETLEHLHKEANSKGEPSNLAIESKDGRRVEYHSGSMKNTTSKSKNVKKSSFGDKEV